MKYISALLLGGMLLLGQQVQAQVTVTGQISDKDNNLVLPYASIINKTTGKRAYSDQGGFYRVTASQRDQLIFTFIGYQSDTIIVEQSTGTETRNVQLEVQNKMLPGVEVTAQYTPYQLDSITRRQQYGFMLDRKDLHLAGDNTPQGFGLTFSPITRFSRKEKQKRQFKKNFEKAEQERYIDSRYTPLLVARVTGLKGDSLQLFMHENYPDYNTMRMMHTEDLIYWITDKYKSWKK
ncbi:carboxypeptidase-like regulatory domain-containing protein [Chitinophaga agrisoli]|uniref:Carboxypeptidase-like regulatory domain-containing protein n=1 Tax=Chitinophaga agrisoli TaxID=2607653 RepID=A0A5B2VUK6_9BACT|nr:carboxypeptidase-like regulatory domain-containing protein [Chitinophaga agrisoli]KAA2241876.1 carboxypeptidase-like regulatory domain-containing protein [Chitinophaga agrisoli]